MSNKDKQAEINEDNQLEDEVSAEQQQDTELDNGADEDIHLLLEDARNKADTHWNDLLRTQADLENLRKRTSRDLENAHKYGMEKFIQEILPVWDSLAMAIAASKDEDVDVNKIREGMDLTLKMMSASMDKFNVQEVNPEGQPFDPEQHQAMSMVETAEAAPNTILNVFQKGYLLNGRLIRPAMVVVAKASQQKNRSETEGNIDEQA